MKKLSISTKRKKLDIDLIYDFLSQAYWSKGRTKKQVKKSIKNSICYGLYLGKEQIGFARVLTDKAVFAYLMDLFVIEQYRGKGYAQLLLKRICEDLESNNVPKWYLRTKDAHYLYKKFGFTALADPSRSMEKTILR